MENITDSFHETLNFSMVSSLTTVTYAATDLAHVLSYNTGQTAAITPTDVSTFDSTEYDSANTTVTLATGTPGEIPLNTGQIVIALLSGICCLVTVLGNLLVLCAFCVESRLRTYINYFIVGLSFADLVAGVFTMPLYTVYWVLGYWPFSSVLCDIYLYLNHVFIHISLLAILVLAVDRYQAVYHPLMHLRRRTLRHAIFMISISYIIPFLLWLPWCLLWPYIVGARRIQPGLCYPQYVVDSFAFTMLAPICFFWIPVPITGVIYWRIYLLIKGQTSHRKGPVTMEELESSSVSLKTRYHIQEARSNPQDKVSPTEVDNSQVPKSGSAFGYENSGFELHREDIQENTFKNEMTLRNQSSPGPDTSHPHPTLNNQLPILELIDKQEGDPADEAGITMSEVPAPTASTKQLGRESRRESTRATRTLTLIFIVLIVSTLPWSILVVIYALCQSCIPLALYQASVYIAHMNSTVNPFCYAVANPLYLEAIGKLVSCFRGRTRQGNNPR